MLSAIGMQNSVVTIECDFDNSKGKDFALAITELTKMEARYLAQEYATTHGMSNARCSMPGAPYPVDRDGKVIEMEGQPHRYRIDIPVVSSMLP